MYRLLHPNDPNTPRDGQGQGQGFGQMEELRYPREIIDRLIGALIDSNSVYPEMRRRMGEWEIGFLERL